MASTSRDVHAGRCRFRRVSYLVVQIVGRLREKNDDIAAERQVTGAVCRAGGGGGGGGGGSRSRQAAVWCVWIGRRAAEPTPCQVRAVTCSSLSPALPGDHSPGRRRQM